MAKTVRARFILITILCTLALAGYLAASTGKSAGGSEIVGRVIERDSGNPLGAEIGLSIRGNRSITLRHIRSSAQGAFEIASLPAGDMQLTTKLEGYASEHQSVSLGENQTRYVEFRLTRVRTVRGLILNPNGNPVAGAHVRVIYPEETPAQGVIRTTYQWETGEVKSDALGSFAVDVHPEKEFVVEASHEGFVEAVSRPVRIGPTKKESFIRLMLSKGISVSGKIQDESGNVVQGAQVRLIEAGRVHEFGKFTSSELFRQRVMHTASGRNGMFRFEGVNPAKKVLVVLHPQYHTYRQEIELTSDQEQLPGKIVLRSKR